MKKLICILLLAVTLCGCAKGRSTVCADSFESEVHIFYSGEEYVCNMKKSGTAAEFSFTVPENLTGFCFSFDENGVKSRYRSLEFMPDLSALAVGNPAAALYEVLCDAANRECVFSGGEYILHGNSGAVEYTLTVSPSGLPSKCDADGISTVFYNQTFT